MCCREPEHLLLCSEEPMTGHDPESHATSLDPHMEFFMMQFNIILPFMPRPQTWSACFKYFN